MNRAPLPLDRIIGRMIRTEARVGFTDCDPYGHMASTRYLEMAINHRMSAVTEQLGFDTVKTALEADFAFVNKEVSLEFRASARFDEQVVIESWIDRARGFRMTVKVRISRKDTGLLLCMVTIQSVAVDLKAEMPMPLPSHYTPVRDVDIEALPWAPGHPMTR